LRVACALFQGKTAWDVASFASEDAVKAALK
jgi:hypothetical protein